jgi:hypothetical protein
LRDLYGGTRITNIVPGDLVAFPDIPGFPIIWRSDCDTGMRFGSRFVALFDAGPVPTAFVAFTVKLYTVTLVSPVTVIGLDAPVVVISPGLDVTVNESELKSGKTSKTSFARTFLPLFKFPLVSICVEYKINNLCDKKHKYCEEFITSILVRSHRQSHS